MLTVKLGGADPPSPPYHCNRLISTRDAQPAPRRQKKALPFVLDLDEEEEGTAYQLALCTACDYLV